MVRLVDGTLSFTIEPDFLQRMLLAAEMMVQEQGPCTGNQLRPGMLAAIGVPFGPATGTVPSAPVPPTSWILHHSTALSAVDIRDGDLVWDDDPDEDKPGVQLPDAILDELFGDVPAPERRPDVRLERVTLRNYRSLSDVSVALAPFTLLVGPNGAGKSNLLDGISRVLRLTEFASDTVFGGHHQLGRIRTYGSSEPAEVVFQGSGGTEFSWTWASDRQPVLKVGGQEVTAPRNHPLARAFGPARMVRLDPDVVAEPAYSEAVVPAVDARGGNVPVVLADLAATHPDRFRDTIDRIRTVIPEVEALRMPRARLQHDDEGGEVSGHALEARMHGHWLPADQLSEGTRIVIALQTLLGAAEPRPRVLLLDDLDRGLHPRAQKALAEQLKQETLAGHLQIVASTHSPFVLDTVEPSCVRMVQMNDRGHTEVSSLDSLPEWEKWRDDMTAGEFWIHAGPDWAAK